MLARVAKNAIYNLGIIRTAYNANAVARGLTVLMYHRVFPSGTMPRFASPGDYMIDHRQFAASLDVFEKLYRPVSIAQVLEHLAGREPLPDRAALITFDDGWIDTLTVAAPELKRRGLPSIVFIPPCIFEDRHCFWQERLVHAVNTGKVTLAQLREIIETLLDGDAGQEAVLRQSIACMTEISPARRNAILDPLMGDIEEDFQHFVAAKDLPQLARDGMAIGAHGFSHDALTTVGDASAQMRGSRERLEELTGTDIVAMSFPQGRYTPAIAAQAFDAGFRAVFTSDVIVNHLPPVGAGRALLGRIGIYPDQPSRGEMADALVNRPMRALALP